MSEYEKFIHKQNASIEAAFVYVEANKIVDDTYPNLGIIYEKNGRLGFVSFNLEGQIPPTFEELVISKSAASCHVQEPKLLAKDDAGRCFVLSHYGDVLVGPVLLEELQKKFPKHSAVKDRIIVFESQLLNMAKEEVLARASRRIPDIPFAVVQPKDLVGVFSVHKDRAVEQISQLFQNTLPTWVETTCLLKLDGVEVAKATRGDVSFFGYEGRFALKSKQRFDPQKQLPVVFWGAPDLDPNRVYPVHMHALKFVAESNNQS